ncbi:MAG: hypothetical protein ACYCQI_16940, partial [Gammaproteobacteria bacterium]
VTSPEAKAINEKRIERVLKALANFEEGILKKRAEYKGYSFDKFQKNCQPVLDKFDDALASLSNEIITCGFVFDPAILERAAKRFEDNVKRFDGWWSLQADVFWVNGFGKLQGRLSSRDAQVVCTGIGRFIDDGRMPPRSFNNSDGTFNFLDHRSRLGLDIFLGYFSRGRAGCRALLQFLCRAKATALQSLCNIRQVQSIAGR